MHVPVIASLSETANNVVASPDSPAAETPEATCSWRRPRMFRKYGRPSSFRHQHDDASRAAPAEAEAEDFGLEERAWTCPRGRAFYRCANGFQGCCSHDPCNPGGSCRDGQKENTQKENTPTATHAEGSATHLTAHHPSKTHHHPHHHSHHTMTATHHSEEPSHTHSESYTRHSSATSVSASSSSSSKISSILSASPTSNSSSPTSSSTNASGTPPPCPAGNGTHFTDSAKVEYVIRCGIENTFISYNSIYVGTGGYGECFSTCSSTNECAGFTFVGSKAGSCYLKAQMPENSYMKHGGSSFITCTKAHPPNNTGNGVTTTPKKAGIIAGAVIGGLILLGLLLFLIACCANRRRKKVEEKRATITHVIQGPIEMQPYRPPTHQREGSTSHDVYPNGGNVPSPVDIAAESNAQTGTTKSSRLTGFEQNFRSDAEGGIRPESGLIPLVLSASVYKRTKGPHTKMARVQEESSTARPDSRGSGSRSPRFHEHIGEQSGRQAQSCSQRGASTVDSPTLGRQQEYKSMGHEIMRNQHLRKTAKYSATPSPKSSSPVRPEMHVDSDGYKWREL